MSDATTEPISFEQALRELEQIVSVLEDGDISLEGSLAQYEKGVGLLKHCYGQLRQAEQRIQKLVGESEDGKAVTELFEHSATVETKRR